MGATRRGLLQLGWTIGAVALASRSIEARGDEPPKPGPGQPPKGRSPEEARWKAWWADLEKDEESATRALLDMAGHRNQADAFLKEKMQPLVLTPEGLNDLLAWLGSDDEKVWMTAFEDLEYFDPRLAMGLEALMVKVTEAPTRQRMVEVLSGWKPGSLVAKAVDLRHNAAHGSFNFFNRPNGSWWAEHKVSELNRSPGGNLKKKWTRAVRAIVLLEHIGTPEALAILKTMATGHPDAQPTRAAREALARLEAQTQATTNAAELEAKSRRQYQRRVGGALLPRQHGRGAGVRLPVRPCFADHGRDAAVVGHRREVPLPVVDLSYHKDPNIIIPANQPPRTPATPC